MNDSRFGIVLKVVVAVFAVIGGVAILGAIGMAVMHFGMMGRMGP